MKMFRLKAILMAVVFGLSLFGFNKQTFAESVQNKAELPNSLQEIYDNRYDCYSLENFFVRQAVLQKHTGFFDKNWFDSLDCEKLNVYGLNDDSNLEIAKFYFILN